MADFTRDVKKLLHQHECKFVRYGKGDHEIWYSPIVNQNLTVDGKITKRTSANKTLKNAGINQKL
ncbi:MAG: type II toxin-antitoxin system HicA family toxin [Oscillospiraceae bacterium]|nr:type II toxin-antitoxin system HicA family toxin [Oscillospiraceae bacterium]